MSQISTVTQLLNSLGVNVHVEYTDGKYASAGNVIGDLSYLGISHVRDAVLNPSNQGQYNYDALASSGIKFDFFYQGVDLTSTMGLVDSFTARHPGSVSLIEGPNEVNNFPISYAGQTGNSAALSYQAALYTAVHSDASLAGILVANLTSWPDLVGPSDLANYHPYPRGGVSPGAVLLDAGQAEIVAQGGRPLVMTEGGYNTLVSPNNSDGVDELTQAKYTLDIFLDNSRDGVNSSYIYELLDAYSDPTNTDPEKHYGIFHLDNSPKIAATAIHNLTTILSAGSDGSAAPSALAFSTSGLPTTASSLTLTKAAGVHDVIFWSEPTIWNAATQQEVAVASSPVTIHLAALSNVTVYDPLNTAVAIQTLHNVQDVTLFLSDHPLVVEVQDNQPFAASPVTVTLPDGSVQTTSLNVNGTTLKHVTGITGQAYTASDSIYSASNVLNLVNRYDAAGVTVETDTYTSDGSYVAHAHAPTGAAYASSDKSYNAAGILTAKTLYDATGKTLEVDAYAANGGLTTRTLYDATGKVTETETYKSDDGANRVQSQVVYDSRGLIVQSSNTVYAADGGSTVHTYDASGRLTEIENYSSDQRSSQSYVFKYAADGSSIAHVISGSVTGDYSYDAAGRLIHLTSYASDGRVLQTYNFTSGLDGGSTARIYDGSGVLDGLNTYSTDGSILQSYTFSYVADGSSTAHVVNGSATGEYSYDSSGSLKSQLEFAADGHLQQKVDYAVDGSRASHTYDASGELVALTNYDKSGIVSRESAITYDSVGGSTVHIYNPAGRLIELDTFSSDKHAVQIYTFVYAADGSSTAHVYDPAGALVGLNTYSSDGAIQQTYTFTYAADGSSTAHVVSGSMTGEYSYGPDGGLKSQSDYGVDGHLVDTVNYSTGGAVTDRLSIDSNGVTTEQIYQNGFSATNHVADEVFRLLGTSEQIVLTSDFGHAVLYGFSPGSDILTLAPSFSTELSSALAHATDDGHGDTLITLDAHNSILLMGVPSASMQAHLSDYHLAA